MNWDCIGLHRRLHTGQSIAHIKGSQVVLHFSDMFV